MRSMFSMGFFSSEAFGSRLGQQEIDAASYLATLNDALSKYQAAKAWQAARPNWQQILGVDASDFQNQMAAAGQDVAAASVIQSSISNTFSGNISVTPSDKATADNFVSEANALSRIIARYPQSAPAPAGTPGAAGSSLSLTTQLLIGGGILTLVAIAAIAARPSQ